MSPQPKPLPVDLTSFVGRKHDIATVRQLFSSARLVTLTGMGGVGKTRLALRVAHEMRRAFPDGICPVELASLKDPALLAHVVVDALGIRDQSARDPMAVLCSHLWERQMLVLLDNCEHLIDAAADLAAGVLRTAPDVRILATSRQALRISGEHIYAVPPLPTPAADEHIAPGTAVRYPSVALFAERAAAVVPDFAITPDNETSVVRLCQRLEGIPLAIELASVRLRALTVDGLADRLDDRFALLSKGDRDLPARHQTLQSLIDWSHELCTPAEQTLWARASVFAGGFQLDALEAVCTDPSLPPEDVLDTVGSLVDKSIVLPEEQGHQLRFSMLDTVRAYGHDRLAASHEEPGVRRRHRDWCLTLVETAADEWSGPQQEEWAIRMQRELPNLRRALGFCLSDPAEARVALRMAAVPWFWGAVGYLAEGRLWLERALAVDAEPTHERAWALATVAYLAIYQGDESSLTTLVDEAHELAERLDDDAALAYVTHVQGLRHFLDADLTAAIPLFSDALVRYADADVRPLYPDTLQVELATALILLGKVDDAAEIVDELLSRYAPTGERWQLSNALWARGWVKLARGDHGGAEDDLCEAIRIKQTFHDTLGLALAVDVLAWTAVASGNPERGAVLLGGANAIWRALGAPLTGSQPLLDQREQYEQAARRALGGARFDAAFERGSALTAEETVALVLPAAEHPEAEAHSKHSLLTRRECEVACLVAQGLSNQEIATRLVISQRTAAGHVGNILSKLGFKSRAQIANWFAEQPHR